MFVLFCTYFFTKLEQSKNLMKDILHCDRSTIIQYSINEDIQSAEILISSIEGKVLQQYKIEGSGKGQISIPANSLASGIYFYQLVVDGKKADVKQMELIK